MILVKVGEWEKKINDSKELEDIFRGFNQSDFFHLVLNNNSANYIECKGSIQQLSLVFTQTKNGITKESALGVSKEDRSETRIPYRDSELVVLKNEILMLEDAIVCFDAFFQGIPFPNAFNQRP